MSAYEVLKKGEHWFFIDEHYGPTDTLEQAQSTFKQMLSIWDKEDDFEVIEATNWNTYKVTRTGFYGSGLEPTYIKALSLEEADRVASWLCDSEYQWGAYRLELVKPSKA
jgi:hypothetical protein